MKKVSEYHAEALRVVKNAKNGKKNVMTAMNNLQNIYARAENNFYKNLPANKVHMNANANKLQEIMRWSQGFWNYKSKK